MISEGIKVKATSLDNLGITGSNVRVIESFFHCCCLYINKTLGKDHIYFNDQSILVNGGLYCE